MASVRKPAAWQYAPSHAAAPSEAPSNKLVHVPGARVRIGKPRTFPSFGWDNEYGCREVDVPPFRASQYLCTNAEFLPFVLDGGYKDKRWWIAEDGDNEGWRWREYRNATHPSFWVATQDMVEHLGAWPPAPRAPHPAHPPATTRGQARPPVPEGRRDEGGGHGVAVPLPSHV